ncbi:glycoside hydrolase family 3 C-terminal domain-containing protein [Paenibacillus albidus]|uniref:glycoside hydrolase family 3 N-terminal domain-containing protein n=1 Tax=Paenibacillus albidus TaxID=2041023 RepID=UPI001BEAC79B|nr:glycoside hydrolase family 3 N-terminal domain-containing protein [Paenibacillus albidus]MBT2293137.1 glycoside hydrolase family 3 C-terminal domain-containing protein [Paenibacillus albidus]
MNPLNPIYKEPDQPVSERVNDLLSRMTLEQKLAQLQCNFVGLTENDDSLEKYFPDSLGLAISFSRKPSVEANIAFNKETQDTVLGKNDLGIPLLLHCESLTGACIPEATIFPSAIGLGATWNPETVQTMADLIRKQMLTGGIRQALSPVMDVARDPRWGRVGETYGEDPTLCAAMSVAFTKGLQSDDLKNGAIATAKHFLGYGASEGGLNMAANPIPARELREVYAKPFQAAITEANLGSVMNSYGSIDGELIITSKQILEDLLRGEMGFDGMTVSDYMSINKAVDLQTRESPLSAAIDTLKAGMDVELPTPYGYTQALIDAVRDGSLDEDYIDRAVRRVLAMKFKLGLFENPYPQEALRSEAYDEQVARPMSLQAAREAIVLVKNDGLLPLRKNVNKIAVIGPHADSIRLLFGCYTYPAMLDLAMSGRMTDMAGLGYEESQSPSNDESTPYYEGSTVRQDSPAVLQTLQMLYGAKTPTILASIRAKCPNAEVIYEKGCDIAGTDRKGFQAAVDAAAEADVVILTVGGKYGWGENCTTGEGLDTDHIGLTGVQEELAKAIYETGTPSILVHMDAKPLSSEYISSHYPAIIENWFPGETGGQALADVLFGDYNPAGRLPMTAARNPGQIPIHASQRNGGGYAKSKGMVLSKYVQGSKTPLHYFGEGLSYTSFAYSNLRMERSVSAHGVFQVSCDVTNTGDRDGEEVVQVYVTDDLASMLRPNKELAGFKRVAIPAGETRTVVFEMRADQFAFLNADMKWIVEAGKMTVGVGASSEDIRLSGSFEVENTSLIEGRTRGFYAKTRVE